MVGTVKSVLQTAQNELKAHNIESFYIDSLILLCFALKCDKSYLIINYNMQLTNNEINKYFKLIDKRKKNMPVKYITGLCEFMSLDFYVNKNVLIPRPETEILVEEAIKLLKGNEPVKVLDLCCGSGCIGISVCYYLKNSTCLMYDISDKALSVAQKNIDKHGLSNHVKACKGDILDIRIDGMYNAIISNPPYINEADYKNLDDDVRLYEPKLALLSENDEYKFYKAIINNFSNNLLSQGYLIFEVSYNQAPLIIEYISNCGYFYNIKAIKDLNGIDRVIIAKRI